MIEGLLLIDKPEDWTSFDVVAKVRGIIRSETGEKVKVGHTGTLDPKATGLLVLAIGKATKQIESLMKLDKSYETTLILGYISTTDDDEGEKEQISDSEPSKSELEAAIAKFVGELDQVPPQFSAIKKNGVRSYKAARKGQEVKHEPRKVVIYESKLTKYEYPEVKMTSRVGSGTYIRSLARDIGQELSTGAYVKELKRTSVGDFDIGDSTSVKGLTYEKIAEILKPIAQ